MFLLKWLPFRMTCEFSLGASKVKSQDIPVNSFHFKVVEVDEDSQWSSHAPKVIVSEHVGNLYCCTQRIHVRYICLHLVDLYGKCR